MKNYNFAAIPTTYKNTKFRSRLEARWAATFDLLHWEWVYEPFDLDGWIPDFQLNLPKYDKLCPEYYGTKFIRDKTPLVEIRPVSLLDRQPNTYEIPEGFDIERIYRGTGCKGGEVLLLGSHIDAAWRIPDLGEWRESLQIAIGGESVWQEAGNKVQWQGGRSA